MWNLYVLEFFSSVWFCVSVSVDILEGVSAVAVIAVTGSKQKAQACSQF